MLKYKLKCVSVSNILCFKRQHKTHFFLTFSTDFIVLHRHQAVTILTVSTVFDTVLTGRSGSCTLGTKRILLHISISK